MLAIRLKSSNTLFKPSVILDNESSFASAVASLLILESLFNTILSILGTTKF